MCCLNQAAHSESHRVDFFLACHARRQMPSADLANVHPSAFPCSPVSIFLEKNNNYKHTVCLLWTEAAVLCHRGCNECRIQVWLIWGIKTRTPQPSTILLKITKVKVIVFVYVSFWSKWSKAIRCSKVFFHSNNMEVIKLLLREAIVLNHCITSKSLQRFFNCFWQTISCSCFPGPFCGASYFHHS